VFAWFVPGSIYGTPDDATARQFITSVSVKF
jgi:hypothetical protein